jgi:hypothetical protein
MQFSLKTVPAGAVAVAAMLVLAAHANAESAYIQQASSARAPLASPTVNRGTGNAAAIPSNYWVAPPEQNIARNAATASNAARTLTIGNFNTVAQLQAGINNSSRVSVIGGNRNDVGVLQGGNDRSNIVMVGTQGMSVGVLQPANSIPVNMLIARLPNGAIVIKR